MLQSSATQREEEAHSAEYKLKTIFALARSLRAWDLVLICLVIIETVLVGTALVPAQLWTRLLPSSTASALDGPFSSTIAPVITALLYLLPTAIGLVCRHWQRALLLATLPAWLGLAAFLIAATFKVGAFYLVSPDHVSANLSVLELFAILGGIGWLGRHLLKLR